MRRQYLVLLASGAIGLVALARCDTGTGTGDCAGVRLGTTCSESQVNATCPDPNDGCQSLVCDGTEYGPHVATPGDLCTTSGLDCSPKNNGQCSSAMVCNGTFFALQNTVAPGGACSQAGLVCHQPGTECDSCTCDGTTFQCKAGCCLLGGCDGGANNICPPPQQVVAGQPCDNILTCTSASGCDAGATGACTCPAGTWTCQCVGAPSVVASNENAAGIAADGAYVYWTDYVDGLVRKAAVDGGAPQTIASGQPFAGAIAVDSTMAYWVNRQAGGGVMKVALTGGTPDMLASDPNTPRTIAIDTTSAYWTTDYAVMKVPIDGGSPVTLATAPNPVYGIAVDATNLYWATYGSISKVPNNGGTSTSLALSQSAIGIAVDSTNLYWTDTGGIGEMTLDGGILTTVAHDQGGPQAIAVDSSSVYWVDIWGNMVMKVPISGGAISVLAIGQNEPDAIAIDSTNVYWNSGGSVMTTPK